MVVQNSGRASPRLTAFPTGPMRATSYQIEDAGMKMARRLHLEHVCPHAGEPKSSAPSGTAKRLRRTR
jgi:hypothetical protein